MGSFELILSYPWWWLPVCLLTGGALSLLLYSRNYFGEEDSRSLRWVLGVLRGIFISSLLFLLLGPLLKSSLRQVEKPLVVIGLDNSHSLVLQKDSARLRQELPRLIQQFEEGLTDKFEVRVNLFGESVREESFPDFKDKISNLSAFFQSVDDRYENRNLGALVFISDGLFNQGQNPVYQRKRLVAPIYSVGLGDTTIQKDQILQRVRHNQIAYLGNQFPLLVEIEARRLDGQRSVLRVEEDGKVLIEEPVLISGGRFKLEKELRLKADKPGPRQFIVSLGAVDGEYTLLNNRKTVYIEVLDGRNKILLLANSPHPDVKAITSSIENNDQYRVEVKFPFTGFPSSLKGYDLLILHQLPSAQQGLQQLLQEAEKNGVPVLVVVGQQTNLNALNNAFPALSVQVNRPDKNEVLPLYNKAFSLFQTEPLTLERLPKMPPLQTPYGRFRTLPASQVLLHQQIGQVSTTDPLLAFTQEGNKAGILYGEGFWRWRLYEYERYGDHQACNDLFGKIIQFLAVKSDKRPFRVYPVKNAFYENERVLLEGELYNESYQLVNEPDVKVTLTSEKNKTYTYNMARREGHYALDAGFLQPGDYRYTAVAVRDGKEYKAEGRFAVKELQLEGIETTADHLLMKNLAASSGGKFFHEREAAALIDELLKNDRIKSVSYLKTDYEELINKPWVFILLLLLIGAEWFIRKYKGSH